MSERTPRNLPGPARRDGLDALAPAHRPVRHPAHRARRAQCPQPGRAAARNDFYQGSDQPARAGAPHRRAGRLWKCRRGRSRPDGMGLRPIRRPDDGRDPQGEPRLVAVSRRLSRRRVGRGGRGPGRSRRSPGCGRSRAAFSSSVTATSSGFWPLAGWACLRRTAGCSI